jgi:NADH-quinone oxidoreductase subunit E
MTLSAETSAAIQKLVDTYPERRTALLPALKLAQAERGWLTRDMVAETAQLVGVPHAAAFELTTFYTMLHYTEELDPPPAPQRVLVCAQLPCALRGAEALIRELQQGLQREIDKGLVDIERTPECFGACHRAPMARVDDAYWEHLDGDGRQRLIAELSSSQNGRAR